VKNYKYANKDRNVVLQIDEDGKSRVSFLVNSDGPNQQELKKWLEQGNQIESEDVIPEPKPKTAKERLEELGIDLKNLKKLLRDTSEE
jgi:hypothetical protein